MGAWGIKALESDAGLDVIDFLEDYYNSKENLVLSEIITQFLKEGFLTEDKNDIDFYYDNSIMSLAELVIMFTENRELDYDNEDENRSLRKKRTFKIDMKSLEFILQYLVDIKNEKPDENGEREYVELWKKSDFYEDWKRHLESLITKVDKKLNT